MAAFVGFFCMNTWGFLVRQLEDLANDLNNTGQYLVQLDTHNWQDDGEDILIRELVAEAWDYASPDEAAPKIEIEVTGDCVVHAQRSDLEIVFQDCCNGLFIAAGPCPWMCSR